MLFPSNKFKKNLKKLNHAIQDKVEFRLGLFVGDEFDEILNNHALHGRYDGYRSINITGNIRLIYRKVDSQNYILYDIGTHPQLYE